MMKCSISSKCAGLHSARALSVPVLVVTLLLVGCATPAGDPVRAGDEGRHAPLIVARSGDTATLSWQSEAGELYTVIYADGRRTGVEWRPLEGAERIRGDGGEIRLRDQMPPGMIRYYRLMVVTPD